MVKKSLDRYSDFHNFKDLGLCKITKKYDRTYYFSLQQRQKL